MSVILHIIYCPQGGSSVTQLCIFQSLFGSIIQYSSTSCHIQLDATVLITIIQKLLMAPCASTNSMLPCNTPAVGNLCKIVGWRQSSTSKMARMKCWQKALNCPGLRIVELSRGRVGVGKGNISEAQPRLRKSLDHTAIELVTMYYLATPASF